MQFYVTGSQESELSLSSLPVTGPVGASQSEFGTQVLPATCDISGLHTEASGWRKQNQFSTFRQMEECLKTRFKNQQMANQVIRDEMTNVYQRIPLKHTEKEAFVRRHLYE